MVCLFIYVLVGSTWHCGHLVREEGADCFTFHWFTTSIMGGWVRQRCRVSCVNGASSWYWLTVGQGLLSLQQVRVEGVVLFLLFLQHFYFHSFSSFSPVSLLYLLYYLFHLSSRFLWEMTQKDPQGLTCRKTPTQSINCNAYAVLYSLFTHHLGVTSRLGAVIMALPEQLVTSLRFIFRIILSHYQ